MHALEDITRIVATEAGKAGMTIKELDNRSNSGYACYEIRVHGDASACNMPLASWQAFMRPLITEFGMVKVIPASIDWSRDFWGWSPITLIRIPLKPVQANSQATGAACSSAYRTTSRPWHFFSEARIEATLTISLTEFGLPDITISSDLRGDALKTAILEAVYTVMQHCDTLDSRIGWETFLYRFKDQPSEAFRVLSTPQGFFTWLANLVFGMRTDAVEALDNLVVGAHQRYNEMASLI